MSVQLSREHQRLTQQCLDLQDQLTELRQLNSAELASLERQLVSDMSVCVLELDAVVSVCVQSANGDEPNLSVLLGMPRKCTVFFLHTAVDVLLVGRKYRRWF